MSFNKNISKFYKPVGYKIAPEMALRDYEDPLNSNSRGFSSDLRSPFNKLGATSGLDNTDTFGTRNQIVANEVQFGLSDESSSTSLSSSSSDLMSSSVTEGKCCEEHLSLTREMAIRLLKEYVKNLKDFSSMMREKQSTTLRDTSTSPIHSPVLDSHDKQKCAIKRDTQNSDNTVSRQRPSSMLGVSDMHQTPHDLAQSDRAKPPTSFFSSLDHVVDIPVSFMKKQNFTARSVCKVIKQPDKPSNYLEESHSTKIDKQNWFNKNGLDSDDSGQQTPVNFEPGLQTAVLKSEKHYQLEKDPGNSVPILSSTSTFDNNQSSKDCKTETQNHLDKIVMVPPQPDILRFERPHKPNVIIADERLNGEGVVTEKQSEYKTDHVTEINKPPHWYVDSRFSINNYSKTSQNGFLNHTNHPSIKIYTESEVQSVPTYDEYSFTNETNKAKPIRTADETPILGRGTRTHIVTEDSALLSNKSPNKYGFWPNSNQISPTVPQQVNLSTKQQDNISQYKSDIFHQRKSDKMIQTDDFDDDLWITRSLDSPNNQDLEISCESEIPSPVNKPNLQTWTLSLQSIVRPTESESILPKANEINCMDHVNVHIEKTKPSESKIQPNLDYHKELWRRHSLRINPSESDNYQATQRNLNQFNDRPNQRLSLPRKPRNTSRFSIGSSSELDTPKSRSVHFSNDVLVAHTGSGPEPLLLSSAPLKESASDDEQEQNGKPSYFTKLSVDCGYNMSNFSKPPKSRTNINRPSAPLPFRRQFVLNTSNNVNS
ncbi:unnamed protein product [Schistosoma rodhaini]|uniref:Uncharacterized protein n=1 Tax=Schistosoma rodhaini TaxID=6188 RepID=A0AA85EWB7_9TREM|nr:unnamed protein product [Schistosoma rodhaini]